MLGAGGSVAREASEEAHGMAPVPHVPWTAPGSAPATVAGDRFPGSADPPCSYSMHLLRAPDDKYSCPLGGQFGGLFTASQGVPAEALLLIFFFFSVSPATLPHSCSLGTSPR